VANNGRAAGMGMVPMFRVTVSPPLIVQTYVPMVIPSWANVPPVNVSVELSFVPLT
jgi:hypothetical protein